MDSLISVLYTLVFMVLSIYLVIYIFKFMKLSFNKNSDKLLIAPRYLLIWDGIFIVLLISVAVEFITTRRVFSYYLIIVLFLVIYEVTTRLFVIYDKNHVLIKSKMFHRSDIEISAFNESNKNNDFWLVKSKSSTRVVFVIAKKERMDMLRNKIRQISEE